MHEKERLLYRVERMVERKRRNEGEGVSEGLGWYMLLLLQPRAKKRAVEKKNNNVGLFFSFWFFLLICILLQSWFQFNEMCVCVYRWIMLNLCVRPNFFFSLSQTELNFLILLQIRNINEQTIREIEKKKRKRDDYY